MTSRLGGPYGSAAYLAAAMCVLVPISIGLAIDSGQSRWWRALAGLSALAGTVGLVGSGTRGAWIAIAVTLVVLAAALLSAASSDGRTWTNYDRSDLRSDSTYSWFGQSVTTDRYLVSVVQVQTDPIAAEGGISTSIDGLTIHLDSQNSAPTFTLDEAGETIELVGFDGSARR